jgi:hypothetical protein
MTQSSDYIEHISTLAFSLDVVEDATQKSLTQAVVMPKIEQIMRDLSLMRDKFDHAFYQKHKHEIKTRTQKKIYGNTDVLDYPIGFCQLIRDGLFDQFIQLEVIKQLIQQGVICKKVYLILDDRYFQNAIQLGHLLIDVANDTANPTEARIYYKPLDDINYSNFNAYEKYFKIAEKYLNLKFYPNRLLPQISDIYPVFALSADGICSLFLHQEILLYKDISMNFKLSEDFKHSTYFQNRNLPAPYRQDIKKLDIEVTMGGIKNIVNRYFADNKPLLKQYLAEILRNEIEYNLKQLGLIFALSVRQPPAFLIQKMKEEKLIPQHR